VRRPRRPQTGRHLHWRLSRRRRKLKQAGGLTLLAVLGPGLLAGLSDDDPAGITTYSVLGVEHGYRLLWILAVATAALIVFHDLGARMGVVTGKGLVAVVREHLGARTAGVALVALVVANVGTLCAEFAGVAAGMQILTGMAPAASVPIAAVAVSTLVLGASFHRVEHVLLGLSTIFIVYVGAGILSHPDWGAVAHGLVVPGMPVTKDAAVIATATIGTTLAPWGLAFIQSYAVNKHLKVEDLAYERIDVVVGAVLTGVIGLFVVVSCAATLHHSGATVDDAREIAGALEPVAGALTTTLFGLGLVGAGLLAAAIVPLSTAYSICEGFGRPADVDDHPRDAPVFYAGYLGLVVLAGGLVMIPGAPLVSILVLTQTLNAILLLVLLPMMRHLAVDPAVMGVHVIGRGQRISTALAFGLVALSVVALAVLTVL
jgi:Mn2+/Fe2+ NRAMP family transporter